MKAGADLRMHGMGTVQLERYLYVFFGPCLYVPLGRMDTMRGSLTVAACWLPAAHTQCLSEVRTTGISTPTLPYMTAACAGKVEVVRVLLEEGRARIDAKDAQGSTPLLVALASQETNVALLLAAKGADLEAANKEGETPLAVAGTLAQQLRSAAAAGAGGGGEDMDE